MSGDHPGVRTRRTASHDRHELALDIERVLGVATRQAVRAEFRFDPRSPWSVAVQFLVEDGPRASWRIGRGVLQQGLYSLSGLGDVRMWPSSPRSRATAWLQLASGDMAALFELPVPALAEWLEHTYELVPAQHELAGVDWDAAGADLFRGPGTHAD